MVFQAFVSCITDEKSVTVTVPGEDVAEYTEQLSQIGVTAKEIGLNGAYHSKRHTGVVEALIHVVEGKNHLQLRYRDSLVYPLRSNANAQTIGTEPLHEVALRTILCKRAHWYQVVKNGVDSLKATTVNPLPIGKGSFVPRVMATRKNVSLSPQAEISQIAELDDRWTDEIAIVGMSCRYPSADSPSDFWDLLCEGKTGIGKISPARFNPADCKDRAKNLEYWGNFLSDDIISTFDHKFFGLSAREAKSMDPQQRIALQVAYEALESSGYYRNGRRPEDVGCYLGVLSVDYEDNVESEDATAFSALGTLRAFVSGRLSHQFGLTGPSVTVDTACSSAAVAIHTACQVSSGRFSSFESVVVSSIRMLIAVSHFWPRIVRWHWLVESMSSRALRCFKTLPGHHSLVQQELQRHLTHLQMAIVVERVPVSSY